MGDGGVHAVAMRRSLPSVLARFVPQSLRNSTLSIAESIQVPPPVLGVASSSTVQSIHKFSAALFQNARIITFNTSLKEGERAWMSSALMLTLGALICFSVTYCYVTVESRRRIASQYGLVQGNKTLLKQSGYDLGTDSDELEYEDDSESGSNQESGLTRPLQRIFNFRKRSRGNQKEINGSSIRNAGIVRITSSDPRSSLSSVPIQFDMETKQAMTPMEANQDPSSLSMLQRSASMARRRRESGRLLNNVNNSTSITRTASPIGRASPMRKSSSLTHSSSPVRPPRPARSQFHKLGAGVAGGSPSQQQQTFDQDGDTALQTSSSAQTFYTADSEGEEDLEEEEVTFPQLSSILVREPRIYARKQDSSYPASFGPYSSNGVHGIDWQASQTELNQENGFAFGVQLPPPTSVGTRRLPPGASHAPSSPLHSSPSHKLDGSAASFWPEKRNKTIRLKEPDWTPYLEVHSRARERLETAAQVAANPRSYSPLRGVSPSSPPMYDLLRWSNDDTNAVPAAGAAAEEEESFSQQQEEEFWFERYSQSTAAAGRDWDWRKRRRQRQLAAAAKEDEDLMRHINGSATSLDDVVNAGNVGMTDVHLQKQAIKTNGNTKPLENGKPTLAVTTSDVSLFGNNGRQASSFGKALRLKRYSSPLSDETVELNNGVELHASPNGHSNGAQNGITGKKGRGRGVGKKKTRRMSESDQDNEADLSVPNRLSSLKPKVIKRQLNARRERDAGITAQLLAQAEEVPTDEEDEEKATEQKEILNDNIVYPRGSLGPRHQSNPDIGGMRNSPRIIDDPWGAALGGWSSADAYGASPQQSSPLRSHQGNLQSGNNPIPGLPRYSAVHLLGGVELDREGSKTGSQSSGTSSTLQQGHTDPPVFSSKPRSGSRRGILSSASKAATATTTSGETGSSPMRRTDSRGEYGSFTTPTSPLSTISAQ